MLYRICRIDLNRPRPELIYKPRGKVSWGIGPGLEGPEKLVPVLRVEKAKDGNAISAWLAPRTTPRS